jgi:hypothetical protein
MTNTDQETKLVTALATELAVSMEHFEDDETRWFPESIEILKEARTYLAQHNCELPNPVRLVLERHAKSTT